MAGALISPIDLQALHAKRLRLFGVSNKWHQAAQKAAAIAAFLKTIWPALNRGQFRSCIDQVRPFDPFDTFDTFDTLAQAQHSMQASNDVGKVALPMS